MESTSDSINVIGWGNNQNCTVYAVQITDERVSYIEMGKGEHRTREYKDKNNRILDKGDVENTVSD